MHAQHTFVLWKHIIQYSEDSFFNLACISTTTNKGHFSLEIKDREVVLTCSVNLRICHKTGQTEYSPLGFEVFNFFVRWANKHVACEDVTPSSFGDYTDVEFMSWISACYTVTHINIFVHSICLHSMEQRLNFIRIKTVVETSFPPNSVFGDVIANDEFILRRSTSKLSCFDGQGACVG